jgi:hypothetical protein
MTFKMPKPWRFPFSQNPQNLLLFFQTIDP